MNELYRLVLRLREDKTFSRNRSFDELSHPLGRRARRIEKRLRGIERELRSGVRVEVQRRADGYVVQLADPAIRLRREAYLTPEEHALLCRDPALEVVLAPETMEGDFRQPFRSGKTR